MHRSGPTSPFIGWLLAVAWALACWLALAAVPVAAQERGGTAVLRGDRNVYAAGAQVRPDGPVAGDFVGAGGRIILDQPVGGDAIVMGGTVDVRAPVADDLRAMGGDITVESTVGGEAVIAGGQVVLRPASVVAGTARVHGATVTLDGRVDGRLEATGQTVSINGEVRGNVRVAAQQVELGPKANIAGTLSYASGAELKKADGAVVGGAVTREDGPQARPPGTRDSTWEAAASGPSWVGSVLSFFGLLACGAVFLLLVPVFGTQAAERVRGSPLLALAIGFGMLVALPVLAVLLFVTVLGIPLGIAVMALYPVLLLAGFVVGALFLARLLAGALRQPVPATFARTLGWFALALVLLLLVGSVPFAGALLVGLLSLAGIGALVLEIYRRRQGPGGHAAAVGGGPVPAGSPSQRIE